MTKKRYAIVRVDDKCPAYEDYIFCGRIDKRFRIVDITVDCNKCKIRKNYGDTKEQLIRKVAQGIIIASRKRQIYIGNLKAFSKAVSKIIVEFLGVE